MREKVSSRIFLLIALNIIVANPSISSNMRLVTFLFMIFISLKKDYLLVYLLGTCNAIPFINSKSPLQIVMMVIILKILYYIYNKKIDIKKIFISFEVKLLYILLIWLFVCGLINDFMVFNPFLLGIVTTTSIIILVKANTLSNIQVARYFMYGIIQNLVIGYLSKLNLFGFSDNGFNRLTLARGDANSNALIYGVVVIFSLSTVIYKLKVCNFKFIDIVYIILVFLGCNLLLTTASRGAFISLIVSLILINILNLINSKIKVNRKKKMLYLACAFFITSILIIMIYLMGNEVVEYLIEKYDVLFLRLTENKSGLLEGDIRSYLYTTAIEKGMQNPIIGFGMENFMDVTTKYPHNTYLDYLTAGGILGIFIYIIFLIAIIIKSVKANIYEFNYTMFSIIMSNIYLIINSFTYSAIGDKLLWVFYAILILYVNNNFENKKII